MRALKTVGYVISHKNGENRRALFPAQCTQLKFPGQAIFETGYGLSLGFSDVDYERAGGKIASRAEVKVCPFMSAKLKKITGYVP